VTRATWLAVGTGALVALGLGLGPRLLPQRSQPAPAPRAVPTSEVSPEALEPQPALAPDACELERTRLSSLPSLPGAPKLEAHRAEVLARAKAEPVIFVSVPTSTPTASLAKLLRRRLFTEESPWGAFETAFKKLSSKPEQLRQVLLSDGYLYAEDPTVAAMLATHVTLGHLFNEPEVQVQRGATVLRAARKDDDYVWLDGPDQGEPARLWLFDRLAPAGTAMPEPLHLVVSELAAEVGTTELRIERLTAEGITAQLGYGDESIPAVLENDHGRLRLRCEQSGGELARRVVEARAKARREARMVAALRRVIEQQIAEGLPFDEPKTEEGQQDGKLRSEWRHAYLRGDVEYTFNEDKYWVFDRKGRPHVPQVCVDFVLDTWERMADSWYLPRNEGRARRVGRFDFDSLEMENRRSVEKLIEFAKQHPDWFELREIPLSAQVPLRGRRRFFERLYQERRDYRPGDVVVILGPRDDDLLHYHSFFVVAADPISGMPTWLAANAGRPRVRTWEAEMQNAPKRAIIARVRPRLEWLERLVGPATASNGSLPP
jgi:hypothetical protein